MSRAALACVLALALSAALPVAAQDAVEAPGARLRVLDKLTGQVTDMVLADGQAQTVGRLTVQVDECRNPADNPTADAFAHLTIRDASAADPVFRGWMVASSPALSALDHPRYDVWVLRCDVPDLVLPEAPVVPDADGDGIPDDQDEDAPATEDGNG